MPSRPRDPAGPLDGLFWVASLVAVVLVVVMLAGMTMLPTGKNSGSGAAGVASDVTSATQVVDVAPYLDAVARPAPPIRLTDKRAKPFDAAAFRGQPFFVFFGYTHCADVCPATIGTVGLALDADRGKAKAVFVSVDPERDTPAWLTEYARFMPTGFTPLTGSVSAIRSTADAWGVRYAREEAEEGEGEYSMSHTADVFLVDGSGMRRATFPFGTSSEAMTAVLRTIETTPSGTASNPTSERPTGTPASTAPSGTPAASTAPDDDLAVEVISTSVWAGPPAPVILTLSRGGARIDDPALRPAVQLVSVDGSLSGAPVEAIPVRPPGVDRVSYVASVAIPTPGAWRLVVNANGRLGSTALAVLDPGTTPPIGTAAPMVRTPTLTDVAGVARAITTDPAPDLRLSQTSTVDALAEHRPFVLVVDSTRFKVSPACGRAIVMARFLLDRWPDVGFIHLEPYRYSVVADTAVLDGSLDAPSLTGPAEAWGVGGRPWGTKSMPWVFVVDGTGTVRAAYQGIVGTEDVDVILAMIAQGH
ncbi:MAG: SCO family protein [Chloroflexota bacterium]